MKSPLRHTLFLALSTTLPVAANAAPLFALSDEVELFAYGRASLTWDDNVFLNSTEEDDMIFKLTPGIELQISPNGPGQSVLFLEEEFRWYDDNGSLDDSFTTAIFRTAYDSGILEARGHASYREYGSNDFSLDPENLFEPIVVDRDRTELHGRAKYRLSSKTAVGVGVLYDSLSYDSASYNGHSSIAVPLTGYYRVSPALDVTVGYRFRDTNVDNSPVDYTDNYIFVGVDGELGSPKIRGEVNVGYQQRDYDHVDTERETPSYSAAITYDATANSTYKLSVARDYYTSALGGVTYTRTYATIEGQWRLAEAWFTNAALTYAESDYQLSAREEDQLYAYLGLGYQPNDFLTLRAWYRYANVDGANAQSADFTQNLFTVSASLRY